MLPEWYSQLLASMKRLNPNELKYIANECINAASYAIVGKVVDGGVNREYAKFLRDMALESICTQIVMDTGETT